MTDSLLELAKVSKSYDGTKLLDGVSFALPHGHIATLIGQNGAGKTTLAKIILGLEKCDAGQVNLKQGTKLGYVPQKLDLNFNVPMSVSELFYNICGHYLESIDRQYSDFIPDLAQISSKDLSELSGGQLQKVMILATICSRPELLILDEPTQYLDVLSQQKFYSLLNEIRLKKEMTVLLISHDLFTVTKNSDQVICINGHVCCAGKPADIESDSNLQKALSEVGLYVHKHDHTHNH